jgi:hypothetical protein
MYSYSVVRAPVIDQFFKTVCDRVPNLGGRRDTRRAGKVGRTKTLFEHLLNRLIDESRLERKSSRVTQQHRDRPNRTERIRTIAAGDIWG